MNSGMESRLRELCEELLVPTHRFELFICHSVVITLKSYIFLNLQTVRHQKLDKMYDGKI